MARTQSEIEVVRCFAPIGDAKASILILGCMPGKASLRAAEYYAHPRNIFWRILGELTGANPALPYQERVRVLRSHGIAVWDVLASCVRASSLDSDIEKGSIVLNDFAAFYASHPNVTRVYFNGKTAETFYRRLALPLIKKGPAVYQCLPSTSPANASMSYARKLAAWKAVTDR